MDDDTVSSDEARFGQDIQLHTLRFAPIAEKERTAAQWHALIGLHQHHLDVIAATVPGGFGNVQDIYPLSPLQEGMLFHRLLKESGDTYILSIAFELPSRMQLQPLIEALQYVIERHDTLRTAVLWENLPQALQVVYRSAKLPVRELSLDPTREAIGQIRQRMRPGRQQLDPRQAPVAQLEFAEEVQGGRCYAILHLHHLVSDHESLNTVVAETIAVLDGRASELPVPVQFRTYLTHALGNIREQEAEQFFRHKLADVDEPTAPFGVVDVHEDGSRIDEAGRVLEPALAQLIRAQAQRSGLSAARLFHAAWAVVVSLTSGQDDIVFGSVFLAAERRDSRTLRALGMSVNTLPLRLQLEHVTAEQLVSHTHHELSALREFVHTPLTLAQRCSGVSGTTPLFTSLFNYRRSIPHTGSGASKAGVQAFARGEAWTNYPITMLVDDLGDDFALTVQTDQRIDPQAVIDYLQTAVHSLVVALADAPTTPALKLKVLPASEREQVLELFNSTQAPFPKDKLIHHLFEEQAERTPDALALVHDDSSLTYAQLNAKANQLARYLRQRGVVPGELVGICIERGLDMVVGLLGILKAGGAYVPLDPSYPAERLHSILSDAAPQALLIQQRLESKLPSTAATIVAIDTAWDEIARTAAGNLDPLSMALNSRHLAYLIYTSGSTGRPKGVAIEHRNAVNLICWARSSLPPSIFAITLQSTSLNFDLSVYECFAPLSCGGSIHVVQNALVLTREPLPVTLINTVPSAIKGILDGGSIAPQTRVVNLAGEALRRELVERIFASSTVDKVCNLYGPSETTTYSTSMEMSREQGFIPTIGWPVMNTRVYLLSAHWEPVPIGVVGEIYIGGAGVARGYLNRPELTAERFLPDPFSTDSHARVYRTGDLGRWRADGTIEYLGRNDHQVKIRGFRIELGEIETQLMRHAQINEAVVLAREDMPGDKRLVAYLVALQVDESSVVPNSESLRAHLKASLPEYMIPSAFVLLDRLPLMPNGKLDRKALPAPESGAYVGRQYEAPQGELEEILAGVWQGLLRVERVGRNDNFFELGGHSLLIVQMMEHLRRVGLWTELRLVYENPTLAELASALTDRAAVHFEVPPNLIPLDCHHITPEMLPLAQLDAEHIERIERAVPGGPGNVQNIYPLARLQEGILFHHLLSDNRGDTYILVAAFEIASRKRLDEFIAAVQSVIDRHDILRTAVLWEELPCPMQVVQRHASLPVEEIALTPARDSAEQLDDWMKPERQRLDLRHAPPMRLKVAADPQGNGQWYALLQFHHIAIDHVTLELVTEEVVAHLTGRAHELPEPIPYRNYVAQALAYTATADAESFFRGKLADVDEPTAPFGLLNAHGDGTDIEEAHEELESSLVRRIRVQARHFEVSTATLFHAAWALVLAHASGRDDVVFGSILLGRMQGHGEMQHVLGMLINTLPLRVRLSNTTAQELVRHVQRELVELLNHEQASLATAQQASGIIGSAPLFTTLLNYRHSLARPAVQWSAAGGVRLIAIQERTNYPIALTVDDFGERLALTAQTHRSIQPQRITAYVRTAVRSLVEALERAPRTPALALSVLSPREWRKIVEGFNATDTPYPRDKTIHEIFEAQVARTPDAVAVTQEHESLTYAQLNAQANQLARCLRKQGIEAVEYVPVLMARSLRLLVVQLAILKAGAVYLPLDPELPLERQTFIIRDCGARRIVTEGDQPRDLQIDPVRWLDLATLADSLREQSIADLQLKLESTAPAYVMYTSGSTGTPKGVVVPHHAVNRLAFNNGFAEVTQQDCFAHHSNPAFDASTFEVWGALLNGAKVAVVPQTILLEASRFAQLIRRERVTIIYLSVGLFNQYSDVLASVFTRLRYLLVGGDSIEPAVVRRVLQQGGPKHLLNAYGPTECTTFSSTYPITSVDDDAKSIPIGYPLANARVYILGHRGEPTPIGVTGEIYIGGAGVACGYLNRPQLTAERFIPDRFGVDPNARLYKTGDLGRWRADGAIEFLGRNDLQVKIRGYRIELGEIEARLAQHPRVKEAVVLARQDGPADKRLVAYLVPRDLAHVPSVDEVRVYVAAVLPEYMVPGACVMLHSMPLTSTGKVDRRALPAPSMDAYVTRQYSPAQGDVEVALARVWAQVLGLEFVGSDDNFFDLGGYSLLVLKSVALINGSIGATLRVADVYRCPTVRQLAANVGRQGAEEELIDLSREAVLDDDIVISAATPPGSVGGILLTGATGFVGRFLLAELLRDTQAVVYCLVRATSQHKAMARIRATLVEWDLWQDDFAGRLVAVPGDLRAPRLGVDEVSYEMLSHSVGAVYHCGTSMNHLETYAMAKPANVGSAREMIGLATRGRPKTINFISTLGVFSASTLGATRIVSESSSIDDERHSTASGYVASKWVGEKIFMLATGRGIPCNIFRLGLVWADTQNGRYDELQRVYRLFKSCVLSGYGIKNYRHEMPPTPVDYVARAVVFLAQRHRDGGGMFHISSPGQMQQGVFERYNEIAGASLELEPLYDWIGRIKRLHEAGQWLPIVPLIESAFALDEKSFDEQHRRAWLENFRFDCANTHCELEAAGIRAPMLDDGLLSVFIEGMLARDPNLQQFHTRRSGLLRDEAHRGTTRRSS